MDDLALDIASIDRKSLRDSTDLAYKDFLKTLTPHYRVVWFHIAASWFALLGVTYMAAVLTSSSLTLSLLLVVGVSILYGYIIAFNQLFLHEAAHFNLAKSKSLNDLLSNAFVGILTGQDTKAYREFHFDHHRHLGTPQDTEHMYFYPLNLRFILESLFGVKLIRVLLRRSSFLESHDSREDASTHKGFNVMLLLGLAFNASFALSMFALGYWNIGLSWVIGMLAIYPFLEALRNVLEHRSTEADASIDYHAQPHGETNRLFGDGPVASTFGGAGFNRHMLHHWEPRISYTRLSELENYLCDTSAEAVVRSRQTTYCETFLRLFSL